MRSVTFHNLTPVHPVGARPGRGSHRSTGREWRVLAWLCRHPLFLLVPAAVIAGLVLLGPIVSGSIVGGLVLAVVSWRRGHPPSFNRFLAPRLRSTRRRWTAYAGGRWASVLAECDLVRENRRTGQVTVPRVLRVRSSTPSIDTVYVRMARGQDLGTWTERAEALADALLAHRVAITRIKPAVLAVVVERVMPFDRVIPAPEIPADTADVDLHSLDVGENEYGDPFTIRLPGKHFLTAGASGSGKGSLIWSPLCALGPAIRDGLVRIHMIDLKGGVETRRGARLFHRYATTARGPSTSSPAPATR